MLTYITTEHVGDIIHLSDIAADMADRLSDRMVRGDVSQTSTGGEQVHRIGGGAGELSDLEALSGTTMAEALRNLERAIAELPPEGRRELHAIFLIGRGEFSARDWEEAMEAAATRANESEPRLLAERGSLGPQLSKGLYLLKLS